MAMVAVMAVDTALNGKKVPGTKRFSQRHEEHKGRNFVPFVAL
jgi:hypothetical protein